MPPLPDRVHFLWQMSDRMPARLDQINDLRMLLLRDIFGLDHFYRLHRSSNQRHTMKLLDLGRDRRACGQRRRVLKFEKKFDFWVLSLDEIWSISRVEGIKKKY